MVVASLAIGVGMASEAQAIGLERAFQLALQHDPELAAAQEKFRAEQERVPQARSELLPHLTLQGNYTASKFERNVVQRDPLTLDIDRDLVKDSQQSYEGAVTLEQVLYDGVAWQQLQKAHDEVDQERLRLQKARQDLALRVGKAYLRVLLQSRRLDLAKKKHGANAARWRKLKAQLERGLTSRMDVLQAKVRTRQAKSELISAENRLEVARLGLERLIGESVKGVADRRFAPEAGTLADAERDQQAWVRQARTENLQVRLASAGVEVAQEGQDAAYSRFHPTLSVIGRYSETNARDQTIGGMDRRVYVRLQVPLYEGGRNFSGVRESSARFAGARKQLDAARRQAELALRETLTNLRANQRNADALKGSVDAALAYLQAAKAGYERGVRDLVAVLDAQADLYEARQKLAKALHDELVAQMELFGSVGKLDREILALLGNRLREGGVDKGIQVPEAQKPNPS
jgi:outer membrane protein